METVKLIEMRCGQAYVARTGRGDGLLEMGDVFLPCEAAYGTRPYRFEDFGSVSDSDKRVMTICTMLGCCGSCTFCSVRRTFNRKLSAGEILGQVDFLLEQGISRGRAESPLESRDFHVLYTRMGEPSLNMDAVLPSIYELVHRYPHVRIGMSTMGWRKGVRQFLDHPSIAPHLMMQFSAHGTDEETRSKVLGVRTGKNLIPLEEIALFCRRFRELNPRRISLNFVLLNGLRYDFRRLRRIFRTEDVYIRLSPLNVTANSETAGLRGMLRESDVLNKAPLSSQTLADLIQELEECGFTYAWAPAIDEEIRHQAACGQALETLRREKLTTFESSELTSANQYVQA